MDNFLFNKSLIIGVGLIGSSLARGLKNKNLSKIVVGYDINENIRKKCIELNILDSLIDNLDSIKDFDLIILSCPLGAYEKVLSIIVM